MRFAITDIETTGSFAQGNSITEVAICVIENGEIVHEYESLVNPGKSIPYFIKQLTGISDEMVSEAPSFEEIAPEIDAITQDTIFVAHNVNFDYSFIKRHMENAGFAFNRSKLCTVRLARKAFPGRRSYSLSNICRELSIINSAPHRAMGDTKATVELFKQILNEGGDDLIQEALKRGDGAAFLPSHLDKRIYHDLPEQQGVYYFHDNKGKIIYIGKAKNIKKRVRGHFSGKLSSKQKQSFITDIYNINYKLTGSELVALLLEDIEIKKHWPIHNRAQKNPVNKYSIVSYEDQNGYIRLGIHRSRSVLGAVRSFHSPFSARQWMYKFASEFNLEYRYCGLPELKKASISKEEHNRLVEIAIQSIQKLNGNLWLRLPGRTDDEYAVVHSEDGQFKGFGFIPNSFPFENSEALRNLIEAFPSSATTDGILKAHLDKSKEEDLAFIDET